MPSGLDGNPNPVSSAARRAVLERLADEIAARREHSVLRVGIDGVDGAGKTTLADELASVLRGRGVAVIRSTTDSFHNRRSVRWRRGRFSPEGFYRDSHDLALLRTWLLEPLSAHPPQKFRRAGFDEGSDAPIEAELEQPEPGAVLLFDGLFLARPELRAYWDYFVYVDGDRRVTEARIALAVSDCPQGPMTFWHLARWWTISERYAGGLRLYASECEPRALADAVVDNNDLTDPAVSFRTAPT